jgi:hypothetical protein
MGRSPAWRATGRRVPSGSSSQRVGVCYYPLPSMWPGKSALTAALVLLSFMVVAAIQSWPLPLHLTTHLTGNPGGDTGVYVWNAWVFNHELRSLHSSPFDTETILSVGGPADLSLHNYTVFSNLLALPLLPWLGVVATFNVVYLLNVALAGLGMFLLTQHLGRAWGVQRADAWLAALLFACSPFLVARSTAHFSLVAAAPLPFFVLCFDRAWERRSIADGVAAGACMAWAAYCDPYYAVYCVLIAAVLTAPRIAAMTLRRRTPVLKWTAGFDVPIVLLLAAVALVGIASGGVLRLGPLVVSMRTLYTPVLLLTLLVIGRLWWALHPRLRWTSPPLGPLAGPMFSMAVTAAILLGPVLYAIAVRSVEGRMVTPPVYWRSSAPGVDVLSLVLPNPNHPLAPESLVRWFASQPGRYEENVASIPWVVLGVLVLAWRRAGYRPDRVWAPALLVFTSLALGPFIRIAGFDTHIPTPWTLLRYVPVIGEARMPPRFGVLVMIAAGVLFAGALAALRRRFPHKAGALVGTVAALLAFELLPAPRSLHEASVPPVFDTIAADPRPLRVLNVPFGIRDGLSSLGDFTAASLFFQTRHGKPIVGGYLSRVSQSRKETFLREPAIAALLEASEGRTPTNEERTAALQTGSALVERLRIGWVVIDDSRVSPALRDFVIDMLKLRLQERSSVFGLYVPADAPE